MYVPKFTLKGALKLAQSIEDNNAGKPFDTTTLAESLNQSSNSSKFRMLVTASSKYGLTSGSYAADRISLTPLGISITAPKSDKEREESILSALLHPNIYKKFFAYYDRKQIPREELLKNTLKREFGVKTGDIDICYKIIIENIDELGLIKKDNGNDCLYLSQLQSSMSSDNEVLTETAQDKHHEVTDVQQENQIKQIFVAHGKNQDVVEQLKTILKKIKVPHIIAIEESNQGRPVSKKISDLMHACSSAIFIFTRDRKIQDDKGNEVYVPNANVVFELGAASVLYENKIVIFKQEGVELGSDFKDLAYISFDDDLSTKAPDLINELIELDLFKFG